MSGLRLKVSVYEDPRNIVKRFKAAMEKVKNCPEMVTRLWDANKDLFPESNPAYRDLQNIYFSHITKQ